MKSRFRLNSLSGSITQEERIEALGTDAIRPGPSQFLREFEELLGDDAEPDPQFFVECWTLGVPQAVGNLQIRLRAQADLDEENIEIDDPGFKKDYFPGETDALGDFPTSVPPSPHVWHFNFGQRPESAQDVAARMPNTDAREDNIYAQKGADIEDTAYPMTLQRARQLLGVTVASTQMQIKAAYRQKVREWHPDRLSDQNMATRLLATTNMAAINEAYRLLRIPVV